jgi:hypothetical protein
VVAAALLPHTEDVRYPILALLAATILAGPASASGVDPAALVLGPSDVPTGFRVDRDESGVRSNELEARENPETRALFSRWRRVTGYQAAYERSDSTIEARADLFRDVDGARNLLDWVDREFRRAGVKGLKRARAGVGSEGWVYWGGSSSPVAFVVWRYSRVWSGVAGMGLGKARVLALARLQQRRIGAVLR